MCPCVCASDWARVFVCMQCLGHSTQVSQSIASRSKTFYRSGANSIWFDTIQFNFECICLSSLSFDPLVFHSPSYPTPSYIHLLLSLLLFYYIQNNNKQCRLLLSYVLTFGADLNWQERLYITISGFPKATVQASGFIILFFTFPPCWKTKNKVKMNKKIIIWL